MKIKTIALVGSYASDVVPLFRKAFNNQFEIVNIPNYQDYYLLKEADYIVLRTLEIRENVINDLTSVKLIHRWGTGYDTVDIKAAGEKGIPVAICAGVNSSAVSEMAVLLMLSLYRHINEMIASVKKGKWERTLYIDNSYMIKNKTVGLIGFGNIGLKVAEKVKAFGAKVIYFDTFRLSLDKEKEFGVEFCELDELLSLADIVSLHIPATAETYKIANSNLFKKMKKNAILINTARGTLVNEQDLANALKEGVIAGAALDTISLEPIQSGNPLLQYENVLITPHVGGNTADISSEMVECITSNILKLERGEKIVQPFLVNSEYLEPREKERILWT